MFPIEKLAQMIGMDLGFLSPTFMFPTCLPLHKSIRISPIPSIDLGSSRMKGIVDLQHRSVTNVSVVLFVFIMWPTSSCPYGDDAHLAATDFPVSLETCHSVCIKYLL